MTVQHFTAPDGARLAFRDEGEGQPLIALPGLTRNATDFDYLAPLLPPCRLIRPDYRGRGQSDWTGTETYNVPQEAKDVVALMDHLGVAKASILGTSRGGLIGMVMSAFARERMAGLCLNDVGPALERVGLERIFDYVGRNPKAADLDAAAEMLSRSPGFDGVPMTRWREEAGRHYVGTPDGVGINYDPALREAFLAAFEGPEGDLWPLFDGLEGMPLALIRGANSDLLSAANAAEMRRRRPDMIFAEVPDRAHIPFLDEPEAVAAIRKWLENTA